MKTNQILILVLAVFFTVASCKKDDVNEARPVDIAVQLTVNEEEVWFDVPYEDAVIKLVNKSNGQTYDVKADTDGKILLHQLVPGIYDINVTLTIPAETYAELTGVNREDDFTLNYTVSSQSFYQNQEITVKLIAAETVGGFVIKQIYYAGSHTKDAALNRDNFIEIYNNTDKTLYADSLLIVLAYGKNNNKTDTYSLPNNQFDWSKSLDMNVADNANEDYVYAKGIFMIPSDGTGKKYPVLPGKSFVLAGSALNHAGSYVNNSGATIGAQKPELTVDLTGADFETWLYPYEQKIQPGRSPWPNDVDNVDVPNTEVFFAVGMRDMYFPPQARESFVLMKVGQEFDLDNIPSFATPIERTVDDETTKYPQLPAKYILDAVEIEHYEVSERIPRRLPLRFDAGATSVPGGPYSSQSIIRKTLKMVNGRRILKDTNNSTNDFGYFTKANPYKGDDSFMD